MDDATGLLAAAITVGCLVYAKPNFCWNNAQMRRARGQFAEAERIAYAFLLFIIGLALVLRVFG